MTDKELAKQTQHQLTEHFKPKVKAIKIEKFYNCLSDIGKRPINLPSDYDCTLRQSGKDVPQLGTQQKKI
jgi:hypothetical protein